MRKKAVICWILAVVITLVAAVYQRTTGPTYPKKITVSLNGKEYKFKLPRSNNVSSDCRVELPIDDASVSGQLMYRRFPTTDKWDTLQMKKEGNIIVAALPAQAAAGKLEYFITLNDASGTKQLMQEAVVIRFKGDVPAYVLIPHIFLIFFAMLLSNVAGLMGAFKHKNARLYTFITLGMMLVGGMIFGPIVQKFAFGEFWTGVPFGWDLTDNKTLIAFVAWIIAAIANYKKQRPGWIIFASFITLLVFSIPHSMFGSTLNYSTGAVTQG
ncbi:MAG: hypothetical protein WCM76_00715 [Bacteroidota bacterium]